MLMNNKTQKSVRWWDPTATILLLFALFLAALRLSATNWTEELNIIQIITFFSLVLGLALGQSAFKPVQVLLYSMCMGIVTIGWQLSLLSATGLPWSVRVAQVGERLFISMNNLFQQRTVSDPILFLTLMGVLFWSLSAHAGYALTRHANAWRATLPVGIALFLIHIYDPYWPNRTWYIASYIFLALLLLSRTHFLRNHADWKQNRTHLPPYIGLDFLRATMFIGGVLVLLSWTMPAVASSVPPIEQAWQELAQPWHEARSRWSNAFASLRATVGIVQDYYGEVLPLGRGNTLTDVIVFHVKAPRPPSSSVRYYWRDRIYDNWTGNSWDSNPEDVRRFSSEDAALPFANFDNRIETSFTFYPGIQSNTLHAPSQPQWVSRPVLADIISYPDNTVDLYYAKATPAARPGEAYDVQASLSEATIFELREAGTNYPAWISERYLQLPPSISARTIELAEQIAEPHNTPYDVADAVTNWLRDNITYNDTVPTPPSNQDIIDWMLFDLREGFCNYYATAEIIMLRYLGIPARLAVGYAQGALDAESGLYVVRQRDAHAWVEVYFPGIGWVEFEPTINQRPIQRLLGEPRDLNPVAGVQNNQPIPDEGVLEENPRNEGTEPNFGADSSPNNNQFLLLAVAGIVILIIVLVRRRQAMPLAKRLASANSLPVHIERTIQRLGIKPPKFIRQWAYNANLPVQARAYQTINQSLSWLGSPATINLTPAERATTLTSLMPTAIDPIQVLLREYESLMYGENDKTTDSNSAVAAYRAAQTIRKRTWIALWQQFLARFRLPKRLNPRAAWQR